MQCAMYLRGGDDISGQQPALFPPRRIRRVQTVEDDLGAPCRPDKVFTVQSIGCAGNCLFKAVDGRSGPGHGYHVVSGSHESFCRCVAKPALGAQNGDGGH